MMNGIRVVMLSAVPENVPYIVGDDALVIVKTGTCNGGRLINYRVTE
jgi:hypothetical protein